MTDFKELVGKPSKGYTGRPRVLSRQVDTRLTWPAVILHGKVELINASNAGRTFVAGRLEMTVNEARTLAAELLNAANRAE